MSTTYLQADLRRLCLFEGVTFDSEQDVSRVQGEILERGARRRRERPGSVSDFARRQILGLKDCECVQAAQITGAAC